MKLGMNVLWFAMAALLAAGPLPVQAGGGEAAVPVRERVASEAAPDCERAPGAVAVSLTLEARGEVLMAVLEVRALCPGATLFGDLRIQGRGFPEISGRVEGLNRAELERAVPGSLMTLRGEFEGWIVGAEYAQRVRAMALPVMKAAPLAEPEERDRR